MSTARTPRLPPAARREQLLDAALEVVRADGFGALTVEAVARAAQVTRPVVYDAFGDLDALQLALFDREEQRALAPLLAIVDAPRADVSPEQFLITGIRTFLEAVRAAPTTWELVLTPPRGQTPAFRERIARSRQVVVDRVAALLEWGFAARGGPLGLDHPLVARLLVAIGEDAARLTLLHPRRFHPDRLVTALTDAIGLLPPQAEPQGRPQPRPTHVAPVQRVTKGSDPFVPPGSAATPRMPQAERRQQLLDRTLALLVEEGFEALSMEAVARRAGVSRVVVYRSFPKLEVLLLALLRREERQVRDTLDALLPADLGAGDPSTLLGDALKALLDAVVAEPTRWRLALVRPEQAPKPLRIVLHRRRAALARDLTPLVESALTGLPQAGALEPELLTRLLLSAGEECCRLALDDPAFGPERLLQGAWGILDRLPR